MAKKGKNKKSSKKKGNFLTIGQYKVAKNKKTKYIELGVSPKSSKEDKSMMKKLIALLGSKVLFVNLFDNDFRDEYDIPDFVKGNISVNLDDDSGEDDEDDEEEDDEEDDDTDDSEDEDDEEEDDEPVKKKKSSKSSKKKKSKSKSEDDEDDGDEIPY